MDVEQTISARYDHEKSGHEDSWFGKATGLWVTFALNALRSIDPRETKTVKTADVRVLLRLLESAVITTFAGMGTSKVAAPGIEDRRAAVTAERRSYLRRPQSGTHRSANSVANEDAERRRNRLTHRRSRCV